MLSNRFDPHESLQLNNKFWKSDQFHNLGLIADLENSLSERGYLASYKLLKRCADLLPIEARKSFLFLIAREQLFTTSFGIDFYDLLDLKFLGPESNNLSETHYYTPEKPAELIDIEFEVLKKYRESFGRDITTMHRQIRYAVPDEKTEQLDKYGSLSDYHNDEAKGLTTMIYLSDVLDPDNGAFQYPRDSHLIPRSIVLTAAHTAVGFALKLTNPDDMTGLPLEFRGNPGVGNFLEVEKAELLSKNIVNVLGKKGTAWTFNGHLLLHRGGKVKKGARTAYFLQPEGKLVFKMKTFVKAYLPSKLIVH